VVINLYCFHIENERDKQNATLYQVMGHPSRRENLMEYVTTKKVDSRRYQDTNVVRFKLYHIPSLLKQYEVTLVTRSPSPRSPTRTSNLHIYVKQLAHVLSEPR
jgi:hypothetical protein